MKTKKLSTFIAVLVLGLSKVFFLPQVVMAAPGDIYVPDDYPTIQAGINAAVAGDTVHVAAGTYHDGYVLLKSGVTVQGAGASVTTIDGSGIFAVVQANNGVNNTARLDGFTITGSTYQIFIDRSSPTITNNIIIGGSEGIHNALFSSPKIINNIIADSSAYGIYNYSGCSPTITNNIIIGNNFGIYNNFNSSPTITNNVVTGGSRGIHNHYSNSSPTIDYNDVWGNTVNYEGATAGPHDISQDPLFVNASGGDYHLQASSPAIDAGTNTAVPSWLAADIEGDFRILDGDGDSVALVDMGADEYVPISSGLLLDFDLTQGSGTTVVDAANGIVGTTHGTLWSYDPGGMPVLYFDNPIKYWFGDGDYFEIPYHDALNSPSISIEAVVYPMSSGYYTVLAEQIRNGGSWQTNMSLGLTSTGYHTGRAPNFHLQIGGVDKTVESPFEIPLNEWSRIIGTYDGNDMRLYINGALVAELLDVGGPRDTSTNHFYLGHAPTSNHYFNGYYSTFRMWDRALTADEIASDDNSPPQADAGGPYEADEGETITLDASGSSDPDDNIVLYEWDLDEDGEYDDASGVTTDVVFDDNGTYTVGLRVTDEFDLSDSDTAVTYINNVAPTATFNAPGEVNEENDINLSLTGAYDPSGADTTAGFEYAFDCGDGGGYSSWSTDNTAICPTSDDDERTIKGKIQDKDGGLTEYSADVKVNNVSPIVTVDIASQAVQYSDYIWAVTFTATDVAADNITSSITPNSLPGNLAITDNGCSISGGIKTCTWTLTGTIDQPVNDYDITVTVTDDDLGSGTANTTIAVAHENADIWLDSDNPVALEVDEAGGDSPAFSLTAYVKETYPDVAACAPDPGDINNAQVEMTLSAVGPGSSYTVMCTPVDVIGTGYDATLEVSCAFDDVEVNTYHVQASVTGDYYSSGVAEDVLVVYDPSLGFTTGGGWFYWPDTTDKTNFGYTMKYNKKATQVKGSLLLIRHMDDGSGQIYRVKSNALYGLSLGEAGDPVFGWASFSGKATYKDKDWEEPVGNHEFLVYVEDHGEPGRGADQFWIEVYDKDGNMIDVLSLERPATGHTETLGGGNIVVPHKSK